MLDGLLGRGFSPKCKSLMKAAKSRIENLRKRSEAKQRFLKEDLAKLLANGFDIDAFGRTEEYLAGTCLLSCYDFLEYSCDYIMKWLSKMQKQRECPEDCREPVSSLMFAAARFSDLPELRDLRDTFQDRYGSYLEGFVNHTFVEKLASRPPTMEQKIQLLHEIASEFSIKWDSKSFDKRTANSPAFTQDQPRKYGPTSVSNDKYTFSNGNNTSKQTLKTETIAKKDQPRKYGPTSVSDDNYTFSNGNNTSKQTLKTETIAKQTTREIPFRTREVPDENYLTTLKPGSSSSSSSRNQTVLNDWIAAPKIETPKPNYNYALPPYVKTKTNPTPVLNPNPNPPYVRQNAPRTESTHASLDSVESAPRSRVKSGRNKNSKSSSSNQEDNVNLAEEGRAVKRTNSSSRRKEHSRRGLQILFDDEHYQKDAEEKMMDKLLLHYSKKTSNYDITKLRKKSEKAPGPTRSASLPHGLPDASEGPKVYERANSFDAPHVHPKLPDYDDLAARFAALRGR